MKQCGICGYLFEPSDTQPLRCPRCGVLFDAVSSSEAPSPEPSSAPETTLEQEPEEETPVAEEHPSEEQLHEISEPLLQEPQPVPEESEPIPREEPAGPAEKAPEEPSSQEEPCPEEDLEENGKEESSSEPDGVPPQSPTPDFLPKSSKHRLLKAVGLIFLLLLVAICSFFLGVGQSDLFRQEEASSSAVDTVQPDTGVYYDPQGVSLDEFSRLQLGMTYAQISSIIGGDAYQTTVPDVSGSYSAAWQGQDDPESVVTVRFVNGQAADIQQSGLTQEENSSSQDQTQSLEE